LVLKSNLIGGFQFRLNDNSQVVYFLLGHSVGLPLNLIIPARTAAPANVSDQQQQNRSRRMKYSFKLSPRNL